MEGLLESQPDGNLRPWATRVTSAPESPRESSSILRSYAAARFSPALASCDLACMSRRAQRAVECAFVASVVVFNLYQAVGLCFFSWRTRMNGSTYTSAQNLPTLLLNVFGNGIVIACAFFLTRAIDVLDNGDGGGGATAAAVEPRVRSEGATCCRVSSRHESVHDALALTIILILRVTASLFDVSMASGGVRASSRAVRRWR